MAGNNNLSYLLLVTYYVCHFTIECSKDFICVLNYYVLCILLHSCLFLRIFGKLQDSPGDTTLLGEFSHPIFLVFLDSRIHHKEGNKSGSRICLYKKVDRVAELYL